MRIDYIYVRSPGTDILSSDNVMLNNMSPKVRLRQSRMLAVEIHLHGINTLVEELRKWGTSFKIEEHIHKNVLEMTKHLPWKRSLTYMKIILNNLPLPLLQCQYFSIFFANDAVSWYYSLQAMSFVKNICMTFEVQWKWLHDDIQPLHMYPSIHVLSGCTPTSLCCMSTIPNMQVSLMTLSTPTC